MKKLFFIIPLIIIFIVLLCLKLKLSKKNFKNGEIRIFCWGQYIADGSDGSLNILEAFEKEENINVAAFNTFDSAEQMYAKLKNGNCNYDVVFSSDYMIKRLINENLIQKIDTQKLKNYENINQNFKGSVLGYDKYDEYSIPYSWGHMAITYNSKLIKLLTGIDAEKVVTGWEALFNPLLNQEVLMFINSRDSFSIAQKLLGNSLNTQNKEHILSASNVLKKQRKIVQAYVMDEMFDKMESGSALISPAYSGDIISMMKNNKDLKYCFPKQGSNIFVDAVCVPKNAKNKDNALKFIDFLCRGDVALENAMFINYSTPNKKAYEMLPNELKNNKIAYPPYEIIKKCEAHMPLTKENTALIETLWANIRN